MRYGLVGGGRRHRVVAARMPGVAAQKTAQRQIHATHGTVLVDRFLGVARAARIEAAVRAEQRAHEVAIPAQRCFQDDAHCLITARQCFSRLRTIAALSASRAPLRALTTMSSAGSSC